MSQIVGRRLDIPDSSSLVLFREAPAATIDPPVSPSKGAIEASRQKQDQIKKNIDKLKWHGTKPKLHLVPMVVKQPTTARPKSIANKNIPMSAEGSNENKKPVDPAHQVEVRTKRAAEWLNNEKKEIHSKIQEKANFRESAKELDIRRRQILMEDARRKKKAQLELLHLEKDQQPQPTDGAEGDDPVDEDEERHEANVLLRMSNETVIDKLAENMLLPKTHLPIVPRLSKNYVNRTSLVLKESTEAPCSPVHLVRNRPERSDGQGLGEDEEEEEYGEDDFEGPESSSAPAAGASSSAGGARKSSKPKVQEDLITLRAREEAEKRREEGKQFLRLQKLKILAKEREEKEAEKREAEKKREMLEKLQSTVVTINEKHAEEQQKLRTSQLATLKSKQRPSRVFQFTNDGSDFHRNYENDESNEVGEREQEETLDLRHRPEEDDVPLQDFLRPKRGDRSEPTAAASVSSSQHKNKVTNTPSSAGSGRGGAGSASKRSDTRSRSVDSSSRRKSASGTPEDKNGVAAKSAAPFRFYGWKTDQVHAVAKAKEYYNNVVVPNVVINEAAEPRVSHSAEVAGGGLKGRPAHLQHHHHQDASHQRLSSSSEGRTRRRPKQQRQHHVRESHEGHTAASLDHYASQERLNRGRSLINDAFDNDVLELLNHSDLPSSQNTAFHGVRHNALADLHKLQTQPALNLPIQQSLDVSAMASRNLTEVKKAIDNVDRLCQLLNNRTQELENKLSVRESMESVDLSAMRAAVAAKLAAKTKNLLEAAGPLVEEEEEDESEESNEASTSDEERDTEVENYRRSLQKASLPRYESEDAGEEEDEEESQSQGSEEAEEVDQEDFYANRLQLSQSENEDSVRQSYDGMPSVSTSRFSKFQSAEAKGNKDHLHVQYDRTTVEDPVLRHQLGLLADKNHIIAKYSKLDLSKEDESIDFKRRQDEYDMLYTAVDQQRRDNSAKSFGSLPKPVSKFRGQETQSDLPSLRNVGELAGLLRTNFLKEEDQDRPEFDVGSDESDDDKDLRAVNIVAKAMVQKKKQSEKTPEKEAIEPEVKQQVSVKSSLDSSAPVGAEESREVPDSPLSFWDSMLTRPLVHSSNSGGLTISTERLLSELRIEDPARYGQNYQFDLENKEEEDNDNVNIAESPVPMVARSPSAVTSAPATTGASLPESAPSPKEEAPSKLSPAELKELFQKEMQKQDEYINFSVELAEIEKANAIQTARELQHAAQMRSEQELAQLKMQQELELQKYAYENSLAISLANAHLVAEQNNMAQKEELLNLHSQLNLQQVQAEYNALLSHAGSVSENLEHTKRVLEMESALKAEQDRADQLERERAMNEERDRLLAAQKEMALEHERKLLQERAQTIAMAHRQRQIEIAHSKKASKAALAGSVSSSHASVQSSLGSLPAKKAAAAAAVEESYQDYTVDFEQESRMLDTSKKLNESISSEVEYSHQFSRRSGDDGEVSDEDFVVTRESSSDSEEISEDAESSVPSVKRSPDAAVPVSKKHPVKEVEESVSEVDESYSMSKDEVSDSIIEVSAPAAAPVQGKQQYSAYKPEESDESGDVISEDEDEEVSEDIIEAAETEGNYSNEFDDYSDTFESQVSIASSMSMVEPPPVKAAVGTGRTTKQELKVMKAALLEASRSSSSGEKDSVEMDDVELNRVLDEYKAEMEGRLRAQEQTHKLRVNFLKAKHAQRRAALESLANDSSFTPDQIAAEQQRVQDLFGEERAVLEKERWTMNANSYKEMRKFNVLKKELTSYKANLANNSAIKQEMRESILNVLQKRPQVDEDFEVESFEDSQYPAVRSKAAPTRSQPVTVQGRMNEQHDESYNDSFVEESVIQNKSVRQSTSYMQTFEEIPDEDEEDDEHESELKAMLSKTAQSILSGQSAVSDEEEEHEVEEDFEESRPEDGSIATADSSFDEEAEHTEQSRTHEDFEVTEEFSKTGDGEEDDEDFEYDDSAPAEQATATSMAHGESAYMDEDFEAEESHIKSVQFAANLEQPSPEVKSVPAGRKPEEQDESEDFEIEEEIEEEDESQHYSDGEDTEGTEHSQSLAKSSEYQSTEFEEASASASAKQSQSSASRDDSYAQDFEEAADESQVSNKSVHFENKPAVPVAPAVQPAKAEPEEEEESEIEEEIEESYAEEEDQSDDDNEQSRKSEASAATPEKPVRREAAVNQSSSFEASSRMSGDEEEEEEGDNVVQSQASDSPQQKSRMEPSQVDESEPDAELEQDRLEDSYSEEEFASDTEEPPVTAVSPPKPTPAVAAKPPVKQEESEEEESIEEVEEDLDEAEEDEEKQQQQQEEEATNSFAESSRASQSASAHQSAAKPVVAEKSPVASPEKVTPESAPEEDDEDGDYGDDEFDEAESPDTATPPPTSDPSVAATAAVVDPQVSEMTDSRDISDEISEDFDEFDRDNLNIDVVPKPPSDTVSASGVPKSPFMNARSRSDSKEMDKWSARSISSTSSEAEYELVLSGRKTLAFTGGLDLTAGIASVTHHSASNMRFDKETQRWVGGDDVSLEGFEDSTDGLSPRRKRLSTSSTMSDFNEKVGEIVEMETSSSGNNSGSRVEGIAGGQVGGATVPTLEPEKSTTSILFEDRDTADETPLGVDDSFLSVVSEEENTLISPFPVLETVAETQSSGDSDNTVGWGNKPDSATAVIVTSNVLPVDEKVESDAEVEDEIEEKFSDSEDDLEALLNEIDSPKKDKKSAAAVKLEISADLTVSGNLDDLSLDFIEDNVKAVASAIVSAAEQQLALKEKQADEITDVLMERIVQNSLNSIMKGMDLSSFVKSNIAEAISASAPEPINVSSNESVSSTDSFDAFAEQKASQFQLKHQGEAKPQSPPSLSSLKAMPSLHGNNKKTSPRSAHGLSSSSSSGDENDTEIYNFDDALSSALGIEDKSPIKQHPDIVIGDVPKEVSEKVHTIETITHTEETNEMKVQDVCHHTEDFLNAVFGQMDSHSVDLVEKLKDKSFTGPFVSEAFKQEMVATVKEGGDDIHKGAICDRINEICEELHALKHFPQNCMHSSTFPQRLIAEALPMQPDKVCQHIKKQILDDQHTLAKLLKGEKGLHELLNITVIDSFREETVGVIRDFSDQIAEVILARMLIQSLDGMGDAHDLSRFLKET